MMRLYSLFLGLALGTLCFAMPANAQLMPGGDGSAKNVDVSADESLEWYQDQNLYVARGNAKAIRGDMVIDADLLLAHQREKPAKGTAKPEKAAAKAGSGDIDKMTAEGNVRITSSKSRVTGDHAVYDVDNQLMVMTGKNLRYETDKETVTARDSLEYHADSKIAVARGKAVADKGDRHVEGDILTAEFRDEPNGQQALTKMTATGNVAVITKGNVSRGDKAVYDISRNIAIISGHVKITRADGTQLTGDVGEVDFTTNQSRLLNQGHGRVRALLVSKSAPQGKNNPAPKPLTPTSNN